MMNTQMIAVFSSSLICLIRSKADPVANLEWSLMKGNQDAKEKKKDFWLALSHSLGQSI